MVIVKFTARQKDHLVPTLVCAIQFMLSTMCSTVNVLNFLATLFWQLLKLALVSLTIRVMRFLLPIGMQKRPGVRTHNIFQSNLHIATHSSLSCPLAGIRCNLRMVVRSSLSCPSASIRPNLRIAACSFLSYLSAGIRRNLRIATRNSLSYLPAGIHCTLLLKLNNMPLPGKTVLADVHVLQSGLLFLFVHWFNEGCCVERVEIGEEVHFMGKVTRETCL